METENNKLIAQFMGARIGGTGVVHFPDGNKYHIDYKKLPTKGVYYHSDWNWLMPVVQKIENLGYNVNISGITCSVSRLLEKETIVQWVCGNRNDKIGLVYKTVVEFINWYNENN
jgi:hypothetical protein